MERIEHWRSVVAPESPAMKEKHHILDRTRRTVLSDFRVVARLQPLPERWKCKSVKASKQSISRHR